MNIRGGSPSGRLSSINRWIDIEDGRWPFQPIRAGDRRRVDASTTREWLARPHDARMPGRLHPRPVNNTFDHAMFRIAEIFAQGRPGVPIAHTVTSGAAASAATRTTADPGEHDQPPEAVPPRSWRRRPDWNASTSSPTAGAPDVTATAVPVAHQGQAAGEGSLKTLKIARSCAAPTSTPRSWPAASAREDATRPTAPWSTSRRTTRRSGGP